MTPTSGTPRKAPSDKPLTLQVERRESGAVVRLSGSCTMEISSQIRHCLVGLAAERIPVIVLELSGLEFIDSTGLGGIVAAHLKARHHQGSIRLVNPQDAIRDVLQMTRLTKLFPVYADVDRALTDRPG